MVPGKALTPALLRGLEELVSAHRGRQWRVTTTDDDLGERASHPVSILRERDGLGADSSPGCPAPRRPADSRPGR